MKKLPAELMREQLIGERGELTPSLERALENQARAEQALEELFADELRQVLVAWRPPAGRAAH